VMLAGFADAARSRDAGRRRGRQRRLSGDWLGDSQVGWGLRRRRAAHRAWSCRGAASQGVRGGPPNPMSPGPLSVNTVPRSPRALPLPRPRTHHPTCLFPRVPVLLYCLPQIVCVRMHVPLGPPAPPLPWAAGPGRCSAVGGGRGGGVASAGWPARRVRCGGRRGRTRSRCQPRGYCRHCRVAVPRGRRHHRHAGGGAWAWCEHGTAIARFQPQRAPSNPRA
jgi:hypothetical protein